MNSIFYSLKSKSGDKSPGVRTYKSYQIVMVWQICKSAICQVVKFNVRKNGYMCYKSGGIENWTSTIFHVAHSRVFVVI